MTVFKLNLPNGPTRRLSFPDLPSWAVLSSKINALYSIPLDKVAVAYIDADDDEITCSSQEELKDYYLYHSTYASDDTVKLTVQDLRMPRPNKSLPSTPPTAHSRNRDRDTFGGSLSEGLPFNIDEDWQHFPVGLGGLFSANGARDDSSLHAFVEELSTGASLSAASGAQRDEETTSVSDSDSHMSTVLPPRTDKGKGKAKEENIDRLSTASLIAGEQTVEKPEIHVYDVKPASAATTARSSRRSSRRSSIAPPIGKESTPKAHVQEVPPSPITLHVPPTPSKPTSTGRTAESIAASSIPIPPSTGTGTEVNSEAGGTAQAAADPPLPSIPSLDPPSASLSSDVANLLSLLGVALSSHPELAEHFRYIMRNAAAGTYWAPPAQHDADDINASTEELSPTRADQDAARRVNEMLGMFLRLVNQAVGPANSPASARGPGSPPLPSTGPAPGTAFGPWGLGNLANLANLGNLSTLGGLAGLGNNGGWGRGPWGPGRRQSWGHGHGFGGFGRHGPPPPPPPPPGAHGPGTPPPPPPPPPPPHHIPRGGPGSPPPPPPPHAGPGRRGPPGPPPPPPPPPFGRPGDLGPNWFGPTRSWATWQPDPNRPPTPPSPHHHHRSDMGMGHRDHHRHRHMSMDSTMRGMDRDREGRDRDMRGFGRDRDAHMRDRDRDRRQTASDLRSQVEAAKLLYKAEKARYRQNREERKREREQTLLELERLEQAERADRSPRELYEELFGSMGVGIGPNMVSTPVAPGAATTATTAATTVPLPDHNPADAPASSGSNANAAANANAGVPQTPTPAPRQNQQTSNSLRRQSQIVSNARGSFPQFDIVPSPGGPSPRRSRTLPSSHIHTGRGLGLGRGGARRASDQTEIKTEKAARTEVAGGDEKVERAVARIMRKLADMGFSETANPDLRAKVREGVEGGMPKIPASPAPNTSTQDAATVLNNAMRDMSLRDMEDDVVTSLLEELVARNRTPVAGVASGSGTRLR